MTVLVTGGAGFIGSHVALSLVQRGIDTVVFDNLSTGFRWLVPRECAFVHGDIGDRHLLNELMAKFEFEAIFHFAAKLIVPESFDDPVGYYKTNIIGTTNLLECALLNKVKYFIFSSSAAVYGDSVQGIVSEVSNLNPVSPYGRSKLAMEWILKDVSGAGKIRSLSFRYFNVAGADPACRSGQANSNAGHLIKAAVRTALGLNSELTVFGTDYPTPDGTCVRDYIHVSDLAEAHVLGLQYLMRGGKSDVFNCGYGRGFSVLDVVNSVRTISGKSFPVHTAGRRYGDPVSLIADASTIQAALGWQPKHDSIDTIVKDSLQWEQHLLALSKV